VSEFREVGKVGEIRPGRGKVFDLGGTPVAVFHTDGGYYAIHNTCPHAQGPLAEGVVDGTIVKCPWHGWRFDMTTGACLVTADASVTSYAVRVEGDAILVGISSA
jgi:NAD(P)H-dependent nitrite reductase small subunit